MATINSRTTVLRSTPASMLIQGAFNGATLATAIAELLGGKEVLPVPGTTRKLVSLWLYWTPNEPERDEPPTPIPRKRQKASKAAPIKAESLIKSEIKDEPPPPVTPRQSGATNLVLSSPPRPPPQR